MIYNNKIYYNYDKESKILYKHYTGLIKIEDIISSWNYAFEMNLLSRQVKGIILDYSRASFDLKIKMDTEIVIFYLENLNFFGGLRIAVVLSNPDEFIVPMLARHEEYGLDSALFICMDRAKNWIIENG